MTLSFRFMGVGEETYVSMKLTPMNSLRTRISPSLSSGTGRSVFHWSTSTPPFSSMRMPDMVLGMGGMVMAGCIFWCCGVDLDSLRVEKDKMG